VEGKFSNSKCASISQMCKREPLKPGHHLFIAPRTNMVVTPSLGEYSDRPDASVELTGHAAPRPIALRRPHGLLDSTMTARSSNGHCAPTVKHDDRTHNFLDRTRRCAHHPHAQRHNRTRSTQRPDATVPAFGRGPESSHHDRTRRASDQLFVMHCTNGCPTGRAGSARDRTRRSATLSRVRLPAV
jgi:hypothetical protein